MNYTKIESRKFLNYDLPIDSIDDFEKKLSDDLANQAFEDYKFSQQLATEMYRPGYLDLLAEKREDIFKSITPKTDNNQKIRTKYILVSIAAIGLLLVFSLQLFTNFQSNFSLEEQIVQSGQHSLNLDHLGILTRGDTPEDLSFLIDLYKSERYAVLLNEVGSSNEDPIVNLLKARSFMHLKEYEKALELLTVYNMPDYPQRDALLWTLVEIEMALNNLGNVEKYLNEIIKSKYPTYKNAEIILSKIKQYE